MNRHERRRLDKLSKATRSWFIFPDRPECISTAGIKSFKLVTDGDHFIDANTAEDAAYIMKAIRKMEAA